MFENERHASVHSDNTKEGLSLFGSFAVTCQKIPIRLIIIGILNHTRSALGRSLMRTWFLRPLLSLQVIKERHDAVECFMRPENQVPSSTIHAHLKGIKNLPRILSTMKSGRAKLPDWQGLVKVWPVGLCRFSDVTGAVYLSYGHDTRNIARASSCCRCADYSRGDYNPICC